MLQYSTVCYSTVQYVTVQYSILYHGKLRYHSALFHIVGGAFYIFRWGHPRLCVWECEGGSGEGVSYHPMVTWPSHDSWWSTVEPAGWIQNTRNRGKEICLYLHSFSSLNKALDSHLFFPPPLHTHTHTHTLTHTHTHDPSLPAHSHNSRSVLTSSFHHPPSPLLPPNLSTLSTQTWSWSSPSSSTLPSR